VFTSDDERINAIYRAAVETYRQNTLDVFMDCPTRERAGWLCDSYFTAQSAQYFSGETTVEKVMLENFVLVKTAPHLPEGMLPMCYPADHNNGRFIPQWAMWYFIELDGYFKRSAEIDKNKFKDLSYGLLHYLQRFKNEDGLLERLDSWNFIEWSEANKWVMDVNYPTNMLYSKVLRFIGEWYGDDNLINESEAVKQKVVEQSFDGVFFADNAVRNEDGHLKLTDNHSEVCQYYAIFFDVVDVSDPKFARLVDIVLNVFGPDRKSTNALQEVAPANAFIGNYLRMEILLRWREYNQVIEESVGYFYNMATVTGTLWEHDKIRGSLNHGFASFAGVAIIRSLLGVQDINELDGTVVLDFRYNRIPQASGVIGTSMGAIRVRRELKDGKQVISYHIPAGFKCRIVNECEDPERVLINRTQEVL
jgi:alpha-L-rhamnosidase